jgi:hypothetical protein
MQSQTKACTAKPLCVNKRENKAQVKLTDKIILFGTLFQKPALFQFPGKEVPDMVDPLDQAIIWH